jgi:F-type H+-transporting ATPase subunit epsilon
MFLEIITPEASILQSEVTSVAVPGINGSFQMLENHAPIVSLLEKGVITIKGDAINIVQPFIKQFKRPGDNEFQLEINGGTIEMNSNKVIILVD